MGFLIWFISPLAPSCHPVWGLHHWGQEIFPFPNKPEFCNPSWDCKSVTLPSQQKNRSIPLGFKRPHPFLVSSNILPETCFTGTSLGSWTQLYSFISLNRNRESQLCGQRCFSSHVLSSSTWANNQIHRCRLTGESVQSLLYEYLFGGQKNSDPQRYRVAEVYMPLPSWEDS